MNRLAKALLFVFLLLFLTACNASEPTSAEAENVVAFAELSAQQQEIVDLLSGPGQELMIFEYHTEEAFRSIEVWVEVYQNGELVAQPTAINQFHDVAGERNGKITVSISQTDSADQNSSTYQWRLSLVEDGRASNAGTYEMSDMPNLGRLFGPVQTPVSITNGTEVILYYSLFLPVNTPMRTVDSQLLQEQPELLQDYPIAFLIKCRLGQE